MKKIILVVLPCFINLLGITQIPQFINYQAIARYNNSNIPIPHQPVVINFKLKQGNVGGPVIFDETQSTITDDCGLFNVKIGDINRTGFSKIDWSSGDKFLQVTINDKVSGATELVSVPYALYANHTLTSDKASYADTSAYATFAKSTGDWTNVGDSILYSENKNIGIGTSIPVAKLQVEGDQRIYDGILWVKSNISSTRLQMNAGGPTADNWITSYDENANRLWVLNMADRSLDNRFGIFSDKTQSYVFNISTDGNVGIKTNPSPDYALNVEGAGSVNCLTIKGGCDWYEESSSTDDLQPGEVAVINPNGTSNSVTKSSKAYDKTVVGVVSGAGGINPGIGLEQNDMKGNTKIAMGGKVKVYVVGDVKPGDLLTSSDKPGYAMPVKNKRKAFGTVLGKALSMPDENGLVLMQVMMQ